MTTNQATTLILRILGIADCPADRVRELRAFVELLQQSPEKKTYDKPKAQEEINDIKPEENTIDLAEAFHFDFPKEFNVQVEGQQGQNKIKIFPDGLSETPTEAEKTEA